MFGAFVEQRSIKTVAPFRLVGMVGFLGAPVRQPLSRARA